MFSFFKKKQEAKKPVCTVVARIKNTNFAEALNKIEGMNEENMPFMDPIVGDLLLTYAIDLGEHYAAINPAILKQYGLSRDELLNSAKAHGLSILKDLTVNTDGNIYQLSAKENMTACTIMYPELWHQIESELGCSVVVAFTHRDSVVYARSDSQDSLNALVEYVKRMDFSDTHALSEKFYSLNNRVWHEVQIG